MLYSRSLLLIYFIYSSVYMLIPTDNSLHKDAERVASETEVTLVPFPFFLTHLTPAS